MATCTCLNNKNKQCIHNREDLKVILNENKIEELPVGGF